MRVCDTTQTTADTPDRWTVGCPPLLICTPDMHQLAGRQADKEALLQCENILT
ncbi:hypothetical protein D4764_10G0005630 [Takifugu flavidus]|uniref:Uncharacterized protein n=1 Tax=Takifugu flavidus TaxID=433684 RepID=A0A5C6PJB2_9TELE|nr:hypothetical protein D4764_10G0005630 [Takifugu flavidus]